MGRGGVFRLKGLEKEREYFFKFSIHCSLASGPFTDKKGQNKHEFCFN